MNKNFRLKQYNIPWPAPIKFEDYFQPGPGGGLTYLGDTITINNITNEQGQSITGGKTATLVVGPEGNDDSDSYDYVTDGSGDQVQIRAAINALPANGGRVILREGTYTFSQSLVITRGNFTLEGQGAFGGSIITLKNGVDDYVIEIPSSASDYSNIVFKGFEIDGNGDNQATESSPGIFAGDTNASRIIVTDCYIHDCANVAVELRGQDGIVANNVLRGGTNVSNVETVSVGDRSVVANNIVTVESTDATPSFCPGISVNGDCVVSGNYVIGNENCDYGILADTNGGVSITGNVVVISGCAQFGSTCIYAFGDSVVSGNNVSITTDIADNGENGIAISNGGNHCVGNVVNVFGSGNVTGIYSTGGGMVTGNFIQDLGTGATTGIRLDGDRNVVSGNYITLCYVGIDYSEAGFDVDGVSITGNIIRGAGTSGGEGIILGDTNDADPLTDFSIVGNHIVNFAKEGIKLINCSYGTITGNTIVDTGQATDNTYAAILLKVGTTTGFSTYNVISGNTIRNTTAVDNSYGIRENSSSDGPTIVSNNIVLNAQTAQISLQHASSVDDNNITA